MLLFVASIMHRLLRKKLMPVRSGGASPGAVPQGEEKSLCSLLFIFVQLSIPIVSLVSAFAARWQLITFSIVR